MAPGSVRMRDASEGSQPGTEDDVMSGSDVEEASGSDYSYGGGSDDGEGAPSTSEQHEHADDESDEADVSLADDAGPSSTGGRSHGYRIIDNAALKRLQRSAIDDISGIWGCSATVAKTLLMAYRWDKERLMSELPWHMGDCMQT